MSKIIYIAGLGHSGSTLLDMSLGAANGITGLGELKTLMDHRSRDRHYTSVCSCGRKATECEIWSKVPDLVSDKNTDPEKIEAILGLVAENYGKNTVVVDSSKNSYPYLEYLRVHHDLEVIFLTRDIRSWSYSRHLSTGRPVIYFILRWYLENLKLTKQLNKMKITPHLAGYEELALYPGHVIEQLTKKTGIPFSEDMLNPENTGSHIISGNIARTDPAKRSGWKYDARWLLSARMLLWSPLLIVFRRMNRKLVYSNVGSGDLRDFHIFGTRRKNEMSRKFN